MIGRHIPCRIICAVYLSFLAASVQAREAQVPSTAVQGSLQAAFAPWDDVEGIINEAIDQAKQQILVQAYLLTNKNIAQALISAKRRGVDVRVLADARKHAEVPSSRLVTLASAGIGVWLETDYENAHNKVIVIDAATPQATVITGSFNFSWTAQHKNAENILIVRNNPSLAARYEMNWKRHYQKAVPLEK
ncbi:phospholipase D family protein [Oxalobacteraceae bacterium R-40]|uniref:phospholipase D n=1 Tax=Keguizhuia sedimenti TaxID=3064264 RepID=A0ABU1BLG7_9BURK|nr:phospholipase D family protein [Oxalobacteraceae bacterium R-40]